MIWKDPFGEYGAERAAEIIAKHVPRCETCRYWEYGGSEPYNPEEAAAWKANEGMGTSGECAVARGDDSPLSTAGGKRRDRRIYTQFDFGCIEHQPRETE